jgi:hypothetical protein
MKKDIFWNIFISTQDEAKAEEVSQNLMDLIGYEGQIIKIEKYWKDDKLFDVEIKQSLYAKSPNAFIFELFSILSIISKKWSLSIPLNFNEEDSDITGITNEGIQIEDINWMSFDLE